MAYELPRVFSDDSSLPSSSPVPPEAPPLPLARSVLDRFRYGVRKPSTLASTPDPSKDASITTVESSPASSQSTSHKTGLKIRALDINQTRTHVVLAGMKILKTVRVNDEPGCTEDFNLRTAAVNYAWDSPKGQVPVRGATSREVVTDSASAQRDTFDIEDVAWSNNEFRDYIATAARNGKIMLYDMSRPGVEVGSLHEHFRQVHKVDFNPMEGACLLSGSQDGTVRLWDLRNYRKNAMLCPSMNTFPGRSEGVRHVKWSPRDTWSFAFSTDTGVIQRWDTRHNRSPVLKFSAHHQTCNSIDWHPDGKHLVSGGKDQIVKVWNISSDARGGAVLSLRTPREIQNVRWRPSCFVVNAQEQGTKQCTHFATSYRDLSVVHVWDLRRPYVPFREIHHRVNSGTTDMLWRTKDFLWTVGPEGEFSQTDVAFAPKLVDRRPHTAFSCTPDGQLSFMSKRHTSHAWTSSDISQGQEISGRDRRASRFSERLSFSRSPGDDSLHEQFLGTSIMKKRHSRAASVKSNKSFGATPPSTDEMARLVTTDLKLTMDGYDVFKPEQSSKIGSLPGTSASGIFTYLAQNYKTPFLLSDMDLSYLQNIGVFFERNASCAQRASLYRDSQTWKVIGFLVWQELQERAEANRKTRIDRLSHERKTSHDIAGLSSTSIKTAHDYGDNRTDKSEAIKVAQRISNAPTPVARPIEHLSGDGDLNTDVDGTFELPPSVSSHNSPELRRTLAEHSVNINGQHIIDKPQISKVQDTSELRGSEAAMSEGASQPRVPYSLESLPSQARPINVRPSIERKTSSDSFMIFSTSSDSQPRRTLDSSFRSASSDSIGQRESVNEQGRSEFNSSGTGSAGSKVSSGTQSQQGKLRASDESRDSSLDLSTRRDIDEQQRKQNSLLRENSVLSRASIGDHSVIDFAEDNALDLDSASNNDDPRTLPHIPSTKDDGTSLDSNVSRPVGDRQTQVVGKPDVLIKANRNAPPILAAEKERNLNTEPLLLSDYINVEEERLDTEPSLVKARNMLKQLLNWYSDRGDAQMASNLFLLTAPLLAPPGSSSSDDSVNATLNTSYHDHLTSVPLSISAEAARDILQTFHVPLYNLGISPAFAESILSTYHDQLLALNLFNAAADLRRLAYPSFPAVFEQGMIDVQIGTLCLGCNNPINNPINKMRCESCHERQAECAICLCQESPFEMPTGKKSAKTNMNAPVNPPQSQTPPIPRTDSSSSTTASCSTPSSQKPNGTANSTTTQPPSPTLHTTCLLCNHTTHTACSIAWFTDTTSHGSGGACPVPSCLCDCVRGFYRTERLQKREARERHKRTPVAAAAAIGVRRDDWNVGESRAVGRVRGALRGGDRDGAADESRRGRGGLAAVLGAHGRALSDEGMKVRLLESASG